MSQLRIGVTGSKLYEGKIKIKEFIFGLRKQFEGDIEIISLGEAYGADKYAKKYALEFGYTYREMNAPHTNKNLYSVMPESWYGKPYTNKQMFLRNSIYADYIDVCIVFGADKKTDSIIARLGKLNKKIVVLE
jgi:hypothetical protein